MDPLPQATTNTNDDKQLHPSLRDPATLSTQSIGIRRAIVSSYCIVILLALPIWWYTTSIQRLSLPTSRVHQLAENHLELPIPICIDSHHPSLAKRVQKGLLIQKNNDPQRWKGLKVNILDKVECENTTADDVYYVISQPGPCSIRGRKLYVPLDEADFSNNLVELLTSLLAPYSTSNDPERRVAQYAPHYRLAFTLLNEDAAAGKAVLNWGIKDGLKAYVNPILHRLKPLHNFTIESQVQFHAPIAFPPRRVGHEYGLTPEDLTVFVNSAEWTLSSSSSNDPVLHFVLFVPSATHSPLKLLRHDGSISLSSAFLLPQWGGIVIYNQDSGSEFDHHQASLNPIFSLFATQLQSLLGVPVLPTQITNVDSSFTDWQLDALLRRRALENSQGSQETLLSIVKLVDQIENMPVGEDVRGDVEGALDALTKMYDSSISSIYGTFSYSAESFDLASRAFFNPGMLALLYFPAEHKYGVYAPLFASALIPLIVAALREILAYRRERKQAKTETKL